MERASAGGKRSSRRLGVRGAQPEVQRQAGPSQIWAGAGGKAPEWGLGVESGGWGDTYQTGRLWRRLWQLPRLGSLLLER